MHNIYNRESQGIITIENKIDRVSSIYRADSVKSQGQLSDASTIQIYASLAVLK